MKPKPLSKMHKSVLTKRAHRKTQTTYMAPEAAAREIVSRMEARAILAALEYERQRAEEALDFIAKQAKSFAGLPRGKEMDAFLATHGRQTMEAPSTYSAEHRREQTAAVVPPKKKGACSDCEHYEMEHGAHGCSVVGCECEQGATKRQRRG